MLRVNWANKPVIPIAIEKETRQVEIIHGGISIPKIREDVEFVLKDEDVQRIRQGYVCMNCLEPLANPFPKECPVCKYPMDKLQRQSFAEAYKGTEPQLVSLEDRLTDLDEYEAYQKQSKDSRIVVPSGFNA